MNATNQPSFDDHNDQAPQAPPGFDPAVERAHWREQHRLQQQQQRQQGGGAHDFEAYLPAYELGWRRRLSSEQPFDEHESELAREWQQRHGASPLDWPAARAASRAAWERTDRCYYDQARQVGLAEAFAFVEASDGSLGMAAAPDNAPDRDAVLDVLNHLLANAHDGERGFRECAQAVDEPTLHTFFDEGANQYREMAETLQALVLQRGGTPSSGGTLLAAAQRGWTQLKTALGADAFKALLEQCESAEELSIDRYRSALQQHRLPDPVREPLDSQSAAVRRRHERIRELLDALRPPEEASSQDH